MQSKFVRSLVLVTLMILGIHGVHGQPDQPGNNELRITINVSEKPLFDVMLILFNSFDITVGFEESILDKDHDDYDFATNIYYREKKGNESSAGWRSKVEKNLITLNFTDANLSDVFDSIVKQMRNYSWSIEDGTVNIYPKKGRNPNLERLLEQQIDRFVVTKGTELRMIRTLIFIHPQFNAYKKKYDVRTSPTIVAPWWNGRELKEGFELRELTFKQLLNGITKRKRGGWILKTNKNHGESDVNFIDVII